MSDNKNMSYKFKNGKYIIHKDGVHFSVLPEQVQELTELVANMQAHNIAEIEKHFHKVSEKFGW